MTHYNTLDAALEDIAKWSFYEDATVTPGEGGYTVADDYATSFPGDVLLWDDVSGVDWPARADFPYGCGNTGDGERLFKNARRAARAAIMRELVARERTTRETERDALRRMSAYLRLKIVANRERPSSGALASITWADRA